MKPFFHAKRIGWLVGLVSCATAASAATYTVSSIAELNTRISSAVAGDIIIVQNGVYATTASISVTRVGTAANPIMIQAETVGGVEIAGSHGFDINSPSAHIIIQGFKFTHTSGRNSIDNGATFCRFTRNIFQCTGGGNYLVVAGHDAQIDRNEFRNKSTVGNMIDVRGGSTQIARRVWIHHNYFHDFSNANTNGAETIRFGLSGLSLSTGDGLIEHNLFVNCVGENEMISNKSSGNTYRYNTVLNSPGAEISQRHGNDCLYYGNYMRNTAGMRVYGDRHIFFNNYLEGNTIGINMGNGDGDIYNGALLTAHDRPDDNIVVFNTFINNNTHYQMGGRTGGLGSSNTVVANNIFQGGTTMAGISSSGPYTGSWSNNIRWQVSSAGNMPSSGYMTINPLLAQDGNGVYHIQAGSPAINAGVGSHNYYGVFSSYSYVTADMDGQARAGNPDIGADEFSAAPITARMLTTNDVGPFSTEGDFQLTVDPSSRTTPPGSNVVYTVNVTDLAGSNAVVSLSLTGLPAHTSGSFSPPSIAGSGASTLSVIVSNSASFGFHPLTITGVSPSFTNTVPATLVIGSGPSNLRWLSSANNVWDIGSSLNWENLSLGGTNWFFANADNVLFDDTAGVAANVTVGVAVSPGVMTNDSSSRSYTFSGAGKISGTAAIVKRGASTLTLSNANDFSGSVTVEGGTLRAGNNAALGITNGPTFVQSGGALDVNGQNLGSEWVTVAGAGPDGQGALVNRGPQATSALRMVILAGDTTVGGTGRWDIRGSPASLLSGGQPWKITKVGTNQFSLVAVNPIDAALGDIDVQEGVFAIQTSTTQVGNPSRTLTVRSGATLNFWNLNGTPLNKRVVLEDGATVWNENGNSIVVGPVMLTNGTAIFNVGGTSLALSNNVVSGTGGLVKQGGGTLTLRGANTYGGETLVETGTLALAGTGSISGSERIVVNGGATLSATARGDSTLTLAIGQSLEGNGNVAGNLAAISGSTVSPGSSIGALTVSGSVVLQGTTVMELNKAAGTNDVLSGSTVLYGGTLSLTNLGGSLQANDNFKLFQGSSYSAAFTALSPPTPAPGLQWDLSQMNASGTLRVAIAPAPVIAQAVLSGADVVISGSGGPAHGPYWVLASTNVALPIADWVPVATNAFGSGGAFSVMLPIEPGMPQLFYRIQLQ